MLRIIQLVDTSNQFRKVIADGCILPDGQVAIAWHGEHRTHGTYPSLEDFKLIQSKIPDRLIEDYQVEQRDLWLGIDIYTFQVVRDEDVTGISGSGLVAVGCDFPSFGCVLQWVGDVKSTFWYPTFRTIEILHGHNGKTRIVKNPHVFC